VTAAIRIPRMAKELRSRKNPCFDAELAMGAGVWGVVVGGEVARRAAEKKKF
jgi:hypothetical protein